MIVWKFVGLYMLILLVGLQAIPSELYEAASIDGADRWQTFRDITLPLLRPSLALALILCVTGSLLAFDHFYILTKGGPDNSTVTIVQLIYQQAFVRQNLGTAAAMSLVLLAALLILNLIWFRLLGADVLRRDAVIRMPSMFARTPYYVVTGGLAIMFLFPLVWATVASFSAQPGIGAGTRLRARQLRAPVRVPARPAALLPEQRDHRPAHRGGDADRLHPRRLFLRTVRLPGQEPAVPADARRS